LTAQYQPTEPNIIWPADYWGWFSLENGKCRLLLAVSNLASSTKLGLDAYPESALERSWPHVGSCAGLMYHRRSGLAAKLDIQAAPNEQTLTGMV
jgi:hypothetical protein